MSDYSKLVKALRCKRDDCEGCDLAFFDKDEGWMCQYAAKDDDAADAIEALQAEIRESMQRCAECGDELAHQMLKREEVWKDVIGYMEQEGRNMRLIDANALKTRVPNTSADIFENCRNCKLLDDWQVKERNAGSPNIVSCYLKRLLCTGRVMG